MLMITLTLSLAAAEVAVLKVERAELLAELGRTAHALEEAERRAAEGEGAAPATPGPSSAPPVAVVVGQAAAGEASGGGGGGGGGDAAALAEMTAKYEASQRQLGELRMVHSITQSEYDDMQVRTYLFVMDWRETPPPLLSRCLSANFVDGPLPVTCTRSLTHCRHLMCPANRTGAVHVARARGGGVKGGARRQGRRGVASFGPGSFDYVIRFGLPTPSVRLSNN